jgi:hypothetical protein
MIKTHCENQIQDELFMIEVFHGCWKESIGVNQIRDALFMSTRNVPPGAPRVLSGEYKIVISSDYSG